VPVADPTVTYNKAADTAGPVSVGDAITYTLTATVSASQLTTDLVLTDTLGTGLTFGTVTAAGDFTPDTSGAPVLTLTLPAGTAGRGRRDTRGAGPAFGTGAAAGACPPDTSGAPVLTFTLPAGTVPGTYTVSYTATVNDQAAGQVSNAVVGDQGTCAVDCDIDVPVADPTVTYNKASDPATGTLVVAGQTVIYTLTVLIENSATSDDVVLTDTFSGAQTLTGTLPEGCAGNATGLVCTLPAGTAPGTYAFTYATVVGANATGSIGNV